MNAGGSDCPEHLLGDWSLALWDQRRRRLFLARDHYGITGFYYYHDSRFLAFASGHKRIAGPAPGAEKS